MEERYGVKHMMHEIGSVHILSYSKDGDLQTD
jgi:hypothetical protein